MIRGNSNNTQQLLLGDNTISDYGSVQAVLNGTANLLPWRLHTYYLGALASSEVSGGLDGRRALAKGTLPGIYSELGARRGQSLPVTG